jgi:chitinase
LPVDLDFLFPNPPTGSNVDTEYDLRLDDTWGTGSAKTDGSNDPNNAAFAFWVMASPEEIQVSLSRRDGSHWEVFNCGDSDPSNIESQTVQMICMDASESSNCYKIGLGHGVPGTILEMPPRCGHSKYVVAKAMEISKNQTIPDKLRKRSLVRNPVVYDLTYDFEWARVPRDLGDTQLRVDFSNEVVGH